MNHEENQKLLESRHSMEEVANILAEKSQNVSRRMYELMGRTDKNNDGIRLKVKKALIRCVKSLRERLMKDFEEAESYYSL